ncbi:MAG: DUF4388 domain-containing protein [Pseudomonadota bacterium]
MKKSKIVKNKKGAKSLATLFLKNYPSHSRFAEAFRTLRTNLHFSFVEKDFNSLVVTSTGESEGKTSTVANLSYTLSQAGKSVLMVDADLRRPTLSKLVDMQSPGVTGILTDVFGTDVKNGTMDDFSTSDLFRLLFMQKRTGILKLSGEQDEVEVVFSNGEIVDLNWLNRSEDKNIAAILIQNKLITEQQSQLAMSRHRDVGQRFCLTLLNMGFIRSDDLKGILSLHMLEGLRVALQIKKGKFFFSEHTDLDYDRQSFDLIDFRRLYKEAIIGEEYTPYLERTINAAIIDTGSPKLLLLPSGKPPPNPSELLGSDRMSFLLSFLIRHFDITIIDTPPVMPASDAALLSSQVSGVLLVVKAGHMNRELVKKTLDQLRLAKGNLIGVVLNRVDSKREGYYRYYYKYHSGYYGEAGH